MTRARAHQRRAVERRAATDQILGRMAEIAIAKITAKGFCSNGDFMAAGCSSESIKAHADRARERALHVMNRARALNEEKKHAGE